MVYAGAAVSGMIPVENIPLALSFGWLFLFGLRFFADKRIISQSGKKLCHKFMVLFSPVLNYLKRNNCLAISDWSLSRKARNSLVLSINGNSTVNIRRKSKPSPKVKDFSTPSFWIGDRSKITKALVQLCKPRKIEWVAKKYSDRFDGKAFGMEDFIVFYWRAKETINFAGKGAGAAKNWVIKELDIAPQLDMPKSVNIAKECEMDIDEVSKTWVENVECKSDLVRPEDRDIQMSWSNFKRILPSPLESEDSMIPASRKKSFGKTRNGEAGKSTIASTNIVRTTERSLDLEHNMEQVKPLRTKEVFLKRQLYALGGEGGSAGVVMAADSGTL